MRPEVREQLPRLVELVVERVERGVGPLAARYGGRDLQIVNRVLPQGAGPRREVTLVSAETSETVERAIDASTECDELLAHARVGALEIGFAEVVRLSEQAPRAFDRGGLVHRLLAELSEARGRSAEGDDPCRRDRDQRQQHHRQREHQPPVER